MTANQLRIAIANKQRTKKTRDKWLLLADKVNIHECWNEKTELSDGRKIGDKIGFVDVKQSNGGFNLYQKYGTAFAFGQNNILVIYRGEIKKLPIKNVTDDLRSFMG